MTKAEKIANFIKENNPRRKDIIKFIVVTLNGTSETYFDKNRNDYRGYYSDAFRTWNWNQKLSKDSKTQRYSVTKYYERDGRLYSMPIEVRLEILKRANRNLSNARAELFYANKVLQRKLKQIKEITY